MLYEGPSVFPTRLSVRLFAPQWVHGRFSMLQLRKACSHDVLDGSR